MNQIELHDLESQCVQECAPSCTAACPLHVDVRALCEEVSQGNFNSGLQILKKNQPFPGILSRVCEQPCRSVCLKNKAIAVADLERACTDFGEIANEKINLTSARKQRIAIVGGGLNGMTAAFDLVKKRYPVVIFEASTDLGGRLRSLSESRLPRSVIDAEISNLVKMGVELRLNTVVSGLVAAGTITLEQLRREFEAVYLATGSPNGSSYPLDLEKIGLGQIDPQTHATTQAGIFAASDIELNKKPVSFIVAMSDGRSAAISIDRYIQKVSLTASRVNEGPYESCLYTNTTGIETTPVTSMSGFSYSSDEAGVEAGRCLKCECMECVKTCEYLSSFGAYPKKYARQIYNNLSIVMGTRLANKLINSCSLCGQCAEICPTHMDIGSLCKEARQTMVTQNHMPPSAHDFALRDLQFNNSDYFAFARHQPGMETSNYLFFPGCQLSASSPEHVQKVYSFLCSRLQAVGLMLRCCGAPADWAGRQDLFQNALAEFLSLYNEMGKPQVILPCSSCYSVFEKNLPEVKIISLWQVFDQFGLPQKTDPKKSGIVSIHDPCSTRYETKIQDSVRRIVKQCGYRVEELPLNREKTTCCSYGGDMWLTNRPLSEKVIDRRIAESQYDYLTYCAMCRDFFASRGKPTLHILDLLLEVDPMQRAKRRGPGISQRHENRARLKQKLLKELWGESMSTHKDYESIQVVVSDEVQQKMDDRLILLEDIQQVIEYAERTGRKLEHPQTGRLLAHFKPVRVTYWVEYAHQNDSFVIHNAYSHRMEIGEDVKS